MDFSKDDENESCYICDKLGSASGSDESLGQVIRITRGVQTLKNASTERQDGLFNNYNNDFVFAHSTCRAKYINKKYIQAYVNKQKVEAAVSPPKKKFRTRVSTNFDWKNKCFFCGEDADISKEKKKNKNQRRQISIVTNTNVQNTVMQIIVQSKDIHCREILKRVSGVMDLSAVEAKYHNDCFTSLKNFIRASDTEKKIHPQISKVDEAMNQIYTYIEENDDSQFSMQELKGIFNDYVPDEKTIKTRLQLHYTDNIVFSSKFGSNTIICFKNKQHDILSDAWYNERCNDEGEEEYRILKAAGEIIRRHIRTQVYNSENYQASDKMFTNINDSIPDSLSFLLSEIILTDKKKTHLKVQLCIKINVHL